MSNLEYCLLNSDSASELLEYESKLYNAFYEKYSNNIPLYDRIWEVADNRLKSRIEYSEHIVYIAKFNSQIVWSQAANINTKAKMQLEEFEFSIPDDDRSGQICEILKLFTVGNYRINPYKATSEFIDNFCYGDLRKKGIKKVYATCSKAHLNLYSRMGFLIKDQKIVLGEYKYFIEKYL